MKVTLEKNYRRLYTLDDLDRAKAVIAAEKDDDSKPSDWLAYAVREALKGATGDRYDSLDEVINAEAHTAKNCRSWNAYGDDTEDMDIWIEGLAKTYDGYIVVGAYLSDIWGSGDADYQDHIYAQYYTRTPLPV